MTGDVREINILNHYIGMPPLEVPQFEAAIFPVGIGLLVVLCLASPLHRYIRRLAATVTALTPLVILADLQWRLYTFGHSFDPHAAIRLKAFTPPVVGSNTIWNFQSYSMVSGGFLCLVAAAIVLAFAGRLGRRLGPPARVAAPGQHRPAAAAGIVLILLAAPAGGAAAEPLQQRLASAPPGSTVVVDGGLHQGPLRIRGPLTVVGTNGPVIRGTGTGSVVVIEGTDVVFRGFSVRNSGREVTEEAAGITITGERHRVEHNDVRDVYFGVHISGGAQHVVQDNVIAPGASHGARPGHGISVWHARDARVLRNRVSDARDGIYLSFAEGIVVSGNEVTRCRYGVHSMFSRHAVVADNRLTANLLGAALMNSDDLVLRGNRIEQHREGAAAYGVLLKDIGALRAENNRIVANRVGVYAEGILSRPSAEAVVARNVIAGNDVGLALQSNVALVLTGNRIADNLTDVRALGKGLSPSTKWSRDSQGNSWSQYRGYDADRDGIGDLPHRVEDAMDAVVRRNAMAQAFLYTPAHLALEAAARMFPVFRQQPLLTDAHPLMPGFAGKRR
jgi:nitrous oxidase accessory protein